MNVVGVIVNRMALNVDKIFHYIASDEIYDKLQIGSLVKIPFGRGNKEVEGFVLEFPEKTDAQNLKEISSVIDFNPQFTKEQLEICYFMKKHYLCSLINAIKQVISPASMINSNKINDKTVKGASLLLETEEAFSALDVIRTKAPKQAKIIELLLQNDFVSYSDIKMLVGCGNSAIKSLEDKGVIKPVEVSVFRNPVNFDEVTKDTPKKASPEQRVAIDAISSAKENKTFLLFGVTGSGKTEVFLQSIQNVLNEGKSALVLVPEISLTPQTISRFAARFGRRIAVLHSKLSCGERYDEYKRIKSGDADVVIGVRSAVFAPLKNLGLIVIDEEHENTYKSERIPCYHAREIASFRAKLGNFPLVLASATPSIESYYYAKCGEYELLELGERINEQEMPKVTIVDMRKELANGNRSVFSEHLKKEIEKNIENKEQTILFLNRRGFSTFVSCRSCGYVAKCPDCSVPLTYHRDKEYLTCHYCGYTIRNLKKCPECESPYIKHFGTGTQKIEQEASELFGGSIIRMDVDTTGRKASHEEILNKFEKEKCDILIGTQMVTKGLDFPNVTLASVLAADMSLNLDDFRANERTFSLITQVSGRAGRGNKKGRAVVQTYSPESSVLKLAAKQDYKSFFNEEINLRKVLFYPPFCDIVSILFTSINTKAAKDYAEKIKNILEDGLKKQDKVYNILGPAPAVISKINNKYRWRVTLKTGLNENIREILRNILVYHYKNKNKTSVALAVEINPTALL